MSYTSILQLSLFYPILAQREPLLEALPGAAIGRASGSGSQSAIESEIAYVILTPPQNIFFEKNQFFICFTIAQGFWKNFCFGVNIIFLRRKGSFSKNMDFGVILGNTHIIKMLKQKMLGSIL